MDEAVNVGGHDAGHVVKVRRWGILGIVSAPLCIEGPSGG
jgi:hypothetical protein